MNWFFIALMAPALYAVCNHLDKYLLSRFFKGGQVGSLVLFSSLFGIFFLPIVYFIQPDVVSINFNWGLILVINGTLTIVALLFYFKALENEEASVIVPFMQLTPILVFILAFLILGETLNPGEIMACLLILAGAMVLSIEFTGKVKIKYSIVFLMLGSCLALAVSTVIFKMVAIEVGFWASIFWEFIGKIFIGIFIYINFDSYRKQFLDVLKHNRRSVIFLNSLNETLFIFGDGIFSFASLLAPVAVISSLGGLQPAFVFIFGIILTVFFPKISKEKIGKYDLLQKAIAIILIVLGTYLIREKL
jgi:uncharacterized membrane protein